MSVTASPTGFLTRPPVGSILGHRPDVIPGDPVALWLIKNGELMPDSIGKSSGPVQPGRGYTGACTVAITGLLTTDTILADSTDQPTCSVNGTLTIGAGAVVYGVSISRGGIQIGYYSCAEGEGTNCFNISGALPHGVLSTADAHTEIFDGTGYNVNKNGYSHAGFASNLQKNSRLYSASGWYLSASITYNPATQELVKGATAGARLQPTTVVGYQGVRLVVKAKAGTFSTLRISAIDPVLVSNLGVDNTYNLSEDYSLISCVVVGANPSNGVAFYIYPGDNTLTNGSIFIDSINTIGFDSYEDGCFLQDVVTDNSGGKSVPTTITISRDFTKCVVVGDSLTGSEFVLWSNAYSTYLHLTKKSVGGTTLATIASKFQEDVINFGATSVLIQGGTNTLTAATEYPIDSMWADYKGMIDLAVANGILPVLATMGPIKGADSYTTARGAWTLEWNQKIRDYANQYGYGVLDLHELWVGPDGETFADGLHTGDYIHPATSGKILQYNAFLVVCDELTDFDARFTSGPIVAGADSLLDPFGESLLYPGPIKKSLIESSPGVFEWPVDPEIVAVVGLDNAIYTALGEAVTFASPALALAALVSLGDGEKLIGGTKGAALWDRILTALEVARANRYFD